MYRGLEDTAPDITIFCNAKPDYSLLYPLASKFLEQIAFLSFLPLCLSLIPVPKNPLMGGPQQKSLYLLPSLPSLLSFFNPLILLSPIYVTGVVPLHSLHQPYSYILSRPSHSGSSIPSVWPNYLTILHLFPSTTPYFLHLYLTHQICSTHFHFIVFTIHYVLQKYFSSNSFQPFGFFTFVFHSTLISHLHW